MQKLAGDAPHFSVQLSLCSCSMSEEMHSGEMIGKDVQIVVKQGSSVILIWFYNPAEPYPVWYHIHYFPRVNGSLILHCMQQ